MPYTPPPAGTPEVFRFVNVRNPKLIDVITKNDRSITHDFYASLSAGDITGIEATGAILYKGLLTAVGTGTPRASCEAEIVLWRAGTSPYQATNFWKEPKTFYTTTYRLNGFDYIRGYLVAQKGKVDETTLQPMIETYLSQGTTATTIATWLTANAKTQKVRAWDNLFSSYIKAGDDATHKVNLNELREHYVWILKIINIMEKINASTTPQLTAVQIRNYYRANVILPKAIFPLPKITNTITETATRPTVPGEADRLAAKVKYEEHLLALKEIRNGMQLQYAKARTTFTAGCKQVDDRVSSTIDPFAVCQLTSPNPERWIEIIQDTVFNGFSTSTKNIINAILASPAFAMRYVPFLLKRIREDAIDWARKAGLDNGKVTFMLVGKSLIPLTDLCRDKAEIIVCDPISGATLPVGSGHVKPLGVGDFISVKQELLKYELGEIAHIENIMLSEERERTHRDLHRSETIDEQERTRETEDLRDTQTTERFSVESEAQSVIQAQEQLAAGITVSASYGTVSVDASASYASTNSEQNSESTASSYAKDITTRAQSRVAEKVRTLRRTTIIREIEETNLRKFKNLSPSTSHVIGQYHFVDKFYYCKAINRGKRMMFEFMIPEPAAFHIYAKSIKKVEGTILEKPIAPDDASWGNDVLNSSEMINIDNYDRWASRYGVPDMPAPPDEFKTVGLNFNSGMQVVTQSDGSMDGYHTTGGKLDLPDGFEAASVKVRYVYSTGSTDKWLWILVGNQQIRSQSSDLQDDDTLELPLGHEVKELPWGITLRGTYSNVNLEVVCQPTKNLMDAWKLAAYSKIMQAYQIKLDDFNRSVRRLGDQIQGQNPALNRSTEKTELKKSCLELLTDQKFGAFDAMHNWQGENQYPEFWNGEARGEGAYVKFFENAFEWNEITYLFYPYFWGRKKNWLTIKNMEDPDTVFTQFLQAGMARVVVAVRPGFEEAVLHYIESGNIWNGDSVPTIDDPLYVSILDEIKASQEIVSDDDLPVVGEPWIIKVPTNLVKLNASITPELPDNTSTLIP